MMTLLKAISENSALLERPIVVKGEKAKIGRPPESVLTHFCNSIHFRYNDLP